MNKLILLTIMLAACLVALCSAAGLPDSTSTVNPTYFGVDANDAEAVKEKQRELNVEKFKELFGDLNLNELDFSPELDLTKGKADKFVSDAHDILLGVFGAVHDMIYKPSTTTPQTGSE